MIQRSNRVAETQGIAVAPASKSEGERQRALDSFVKLLRAAHWASNRAGAIREQAGLTEAQFGVLEVLHHRGPLIQVEIAQKLLSSPSNLTLVLDNLERDGLIERERDLRDRRQRNVRLSSKGRRTIRDLFPRHAAGIADVMSALTPAEQEELARLCRKLGLSAQAGPTGKARTDGESAVSSGSPSDAAVESNP